MKPITASRTKQAEQMRTIWHIVPEHGTSLEDVLKPEYWAHISTKLQPGSHIEVAPEDMTFWAQLYVIDVAQSAARVVVLIHSKLDPAETQPLPMGDDHYEIAFKGPHLKWCIIRKSDHSIVKDSISKKEHALAALADYVKALAA